MSTLRITIAVFGMSLAMSFGQEEGFHSIADYRAANPYDVMHLEQENSDDVFDTRNIAAHLAAAKQVRLFRKSDPDDWSFIYGDFERKAPLKDKLVKAGTTVEVSEQHYRPLLKMAVDFQNYGDRTICAFEPGVAVLIGDEPSFVLVCCFKCHDIHVVRRPTLEHPMPHVAELGMSPEMETAIFELARAAFPSDTSLQTFKLAPRQRAKHLPKPKSIEPKDPFAPSTNSPKKAKD